MNHAWNDARDKCKGLCLWDACCLHRLEKGLERIVNAYTPQPCDARTRDSLVRRLNALIQQDNGIIDCDLGGIHIKDISIKAYGSYIIGVYCKSADMDITVEGTIHDPTHGKVALQEIPRGVKVKLLKSIQERLHARGFIQGEATTCLHARIPIVTFVEKESEITCDLSVGNFEACMKSRVISWMCQIDRRVPLLLALVKSWSRHSGVVDPKNGGLNSFALTLLVVFHMQTVEPAILPPISSLFNLNQSNDDFKLSRKLIGLAARRAANYATGQYGSARTNKQSVFDLFASFLLRCGVTLEVWARGAHRDWRISVWDGGWRQEAFVYPYRALVEDPFDHEDNCARTLGIGDGCDRINHVANAFHKAFQRVREMKGLSDVDSLLREHFHDPSATRLPSFITDTENQYNNIDIKGINIPQDVDRIIRRSVEQWDLDRIVRLTDRQEQNNSTSQDSNSNHSSNSNSNHDTNANSISNCTPRQKQTRRQKSPQKSGHFSNSPKKQSPPRRYNNTKRLNQKRRRENLSDQSYDQNYNQNYNNQISSYNKSNHHQNQVWVLKSVQCDEIEESFKSDFEFLNQISSSHQETNENSLSSSSEQNQEYMKNVLWALRGLKPTDQESTPLENNPIPLNNSSQNFGVQQEPISRYCSLKDLSNNTNNNTNNNNIKHNKNGRNKFNNNNNNNKLQNSLLSTLLARHSQQSQQNSSNTQHVGNGISVGALKSISSMTSSSSTSISQLSSHAEGWKEQVLNVAAEMEQVLSYKMDDQGSCHLSAALRSLRQAYVELDKLENFERFGADNQDQNRIHCDAPL